MEERSYGLGLSNEWSDEQRRLAAAESMYDRGTFRFLEGVGIATGMRCLELGAGGGSIARWMAERVGPSGAVLVTDIDVSGLRGCDAPNIKVRVHDVCADPLDEDSFDIVHARLLLENLPSRLDVLAKLVKALRPGGWLVVEDLDFSPWLYMPEDRIMCEPQELRATYQAASRVAASLGAEVGLDFEFARDLPVHLMKAGLDRVGSESCAPLVVGGSPEAQYITLSVRRLTDVLVSSGVGQASVDLLIEAFENPGAMMSFQPMVSAWGCRPL